MPKIFISYRRDDSAGHAGRIHDRLLEHYGADNVFMDVDTIGPGMDYVEAVREAITGCDELIAVIGREWLEITGAGGGRRLDEPQDLVRLEIATALDLSITVIPVLVQGARPPRADDLPDVLKRLAGLNALEISDIRFHSDLSRLIESLDHISSEQARVSALRAVQESPGLYGRRYRDVAMAFEVVDSRETEGRYLVTLSFRPQGRTGGNPGLEQVIVGKEGTVVSRQVLSLPGRPGTPRRPVLLAGLGALVVVVAVGAIGTVLLTGVVGTGDSLGLSSAAAPDTTATIPPPPTATPQAPKAEGPGLTAEDVQVIISKALAESREGDQGQAGQVNTPEIVASALQQLKAKDGPELTTADVEQLVVRAAEGESTLPAPLATPTPEPTVAPTSTTVPTPVPTTPRTPLPTANATPTPKLAPTPTRTPRPSADVHGDEISTATAIDIGTSYVTAIEQGGDIDFFSFNAQEGTPYRIEIFLSSLQEALLNLYDSEAAELSSTAGSKGGGFPAIDWTAPDSGTYYVAVSAPAPSLTGSYGISITGG